LNARYYWRVRALDQWDEPSAWTQASFVYGTLAEEPPPPPEPVTVTGITIVDGVVSLSWTASDHPARIEFSPVLVNPEWTVVPGATGLSTAQHSFNVSSNAPQGFYRVVVE